MNNLAEQQVQVLPMNEALAVLQDALLTVNAADEADTAQNNLMIDEIERLGNENTFLKLQVQTLTARVNDVIGQNEQLLQARKNDEAKEKDFNKKAELVQANAEKHMQLVEQKDRELVQAKTLLDDSKSTLKAYKEIANTPKKVREKIKTLQDNVAKQQGFVTQHKLSIKSLERDKKKLEGAATALSRQLDELDYTKFYSKNGDNLAIYPLLCEANVGPSAGKQVPLWYMDDNGVGALYMLNEDGEPARAATPKTGIKPKKETMELMGALLRKFHRNGNVVHSDDVKLLEAA